jgi:hypothetical protein
MTQRTKARVTLTVTKRVMNKPERKRNDSNGLHILVDMSKKRKTGPLKVMKRVLTMTELGSLVRLPQLYK